MLIAHKSQNPEASSPEKSKLDTPLSQKSKVGKVKITEFLKGSGTDKVDDFLYWIKEIINEVPLEVDTVQA